jgi:hypothetical protein
MVVLISKLIPSGFFRNILLKNKTSKVPRMEAPIKQVITTVNREIKKLKCPPSISDLNPNTDES